MRTMKGEQMDDDVTEQSAWAAPAIMGLKACHVNAPRASERNNPHTTKRRQVRGLRTSGFLKRGVPAFVYVAGRDGRVKVGMTTNPAARAKDLGAKMRLVLPVVTEAARDVESAALTRLGRCNLMPGEWVESSVAEAIDALQAAWHQVARYRRVDPAISEEDARARRLAACGAP